MFSNREKVHLIGIGGIGMSGIAQILLALGCEVSGSDLKSTGIIEKLNSLGAKIFIGHSSANITDAELVVYSSAIKQGNPELQGAYSRGIPVIARAEALGALSGRKKTIAVTGAHGKTSTASLISHMLVHCGLNPTVCVGGEVPDLNGNAQLGEGSYCVAEADESDGSFLKLFPFYSVVTNIDREHLDYYKSAEDITKAFRSFLNNTKQDGCIFFCQDDPVLREIVRSLNKRSFSFGLSPEAQLFADSINLQGNISRFNCVCKGSNLGEIALKVPGRHNVCNALAAVATGLDLGLEFKSIQAALGVYQGVRRRLELKFQERDILVFDDYAHHPAEIRATLDALKSFRHKRILAVFQPHRYSRTKFLIDDFGSCFRGVDLLIVTDIYAAGEAPIKGVSANDICQKAREAGVKNVLFLPKADIIFNLLFQEIQSGDLVAIMGAGDIGSVADAVAKELKGVCAL
jgi:UDP-N-acetylmuramate--alanine ligase